MKFVRQEITNSFNGLVEYRRQQSAMAGMRFDGEELTAEQRFDPEHPCTLVGPDLEWWDVVDGGQTVLQIWLYMFDAGIVFKPETDEVVADIVQFGFALESDTATWKKLADAHLTAGNAGELKGTVLANISFELEDF